MSPRNTPQNRPLEADPKDELKAHPKLIVFGGSRFVVDFYKDRWGRVHDQRVVSHNTNPIPDRHEASVGYRAKKRGAP